MMPSSMTSCPAHNWRVAQLKRLGISGLRAEIYAGRVDWHRIARLVQRGYSPDSRCA
jgi:hypothetical protein